MTDPQRAAIKAALTIPDRAARREVEALLLRLLTHDPAATVQEPPYPHATYQVAVPAPLAGVSAALLVEQVAHSLARAHATRARAAGYDWLQIAHAADLEPGADPDERAAAAFRLAAEPARPWDAQVAWWTCPTCGQRIRDTGPDAGRGEDETGHTPTCQRRLAQLAAWEAEDAADWDAADWDDVVEDLDVEDLDGEDLDGEDLDREDDDVDEASDWNPDAPVGYR